MHGLPPAFLKGDAMRAYLAALVFFVTAFSCSPPPDDGDKGQADPALDGSVRSSVTAAELESELFDICETERRNGCLQGLGALESMLLEGTGDAAGALYAASRDLFVAYAYGESSLDDALGRLDGIQQGWLDSGHQPDAALVYAVASVRSALVGDWEPGKAPRTATGPESPDSFRAWLSLAYRIQNGVATSEEIRRYSAMQARYSSFPPYWRVFTLAGLNQEFSVDAAERCIRLAPHGHYAELSRHSLASNFGLPDGSGKAVLTSGEIQAIVEDAVASGDYDRLETLFPTLELPDNPSTMFAVGALRSLSEIRDVRLWLESRRARAQGRLAERLRYVTGA